MPRVRRGRTSGASLSAWRGPSGGATRTGTLPRTRTTALTLSLTLTLNLTLTLTRYASGDEDDCFTKEEQKLRMARFSAVYW